MKMIHAESDFLTGSEVIFRNLFHSEFLNFSPQKAVQNGGWR